MFSIYILYSPSSDKYYIGYTDDIERRLIEHNELSENSYTSKHRPWELKAAYEVGEERSIAKQIEKFIKKQKSRKYIERILVEENLDYLIAKFTL